MLELVPHSGLSLGRLLEGARKPDRTRCFRSMRCRKPRRRVCLLFSRPGAGLASGILADLVGDRLRKMVCFREVTCTHRIVNAVSDDLRSAFKEDGSASRTARASEAAGSEPFKLRISLCSRGANPTNNWSKVIESLIRLVACRYEEPFRSIF